MAREKNLYRSTSDATARPTRQLAIGAGAFSRLARISVKPRDLIIVAPQVVSPPTDCKPLKQTMKYGRMVLLNNTSVLYGKFSQYTCIRHFSPSGIDRHLHIF